MKSVRTIAPARRSPALEDRAAQAVRCVRRVSNPRVRVFFLPNGALRRMKRAWLGAKADFVDVLAFPFPKNFPHPGIRGTYLGEIYLNEAFRLRGRRKDRDFMLVHGVLHLLGFSHEGKRDTMVMERGEQRVLRRLEHGVRKKG